MRTESAATAAAVVALLLLAALASLAVRDRWALVGVAAVVLALALLDVREAVHQGHEGRSGLMVAALALAVLHLIGAGLGVIASRTAAELAPPPR